eukprot:m.112580 g.112580  ORF g.112580 m.112580 type:complete len:152 (+) comp51842_c1_seq2:33-488(+)
MGKKTAAAPAEKPKPDPVLFQVVKYIRKKVPVKQKIFNQKRVDYCSGRKMLDVLMQSSFASGPTQLITTREDGVGLLQRALDAGYFFRGKFFDLSPKGKVKARKILMGHEQQLFCDEMEVQSPSCERDSFPSLTSGCAICSRLCGSTTHRV